MDFLTRHWPQKNAIEIYTDGGCKKGRGSWAYVILKNGVVLREASGFERATNSLRMELRAAIEAIEAAVAMRQNHNFGSWISRARSSKLRATIFCDARVVVDFASDGGQLLQGRPNFDLLTRLRDLILQHDLSWKWVRAHSGSVYNERCDALCVQARLPAAHSIA